MYQSITIVGRLGQDPDLRMTASGTAVCSLSVGVSETWTKDGKKQERTDWFRVTAWDKLAEICGKYLAKGSLVMFVGRMQQETYEKNGEKQYVWKLVAKEMKMLDSKKDTDDRSPYVPPGSSQARNGSKGPTVNNYSPGTDDSGIPF